MQRQDGRDEYENKLDAAFGARGAGAAVGDRFTTGLLDRIQETRKIRAWLTQVKSLVCRWLG